MKVSKYLKQNNSKTVTNEHDKETPIEKSVSLEQGQKTIDILRLTQLFYW